VTEDLDYYAYPVPYHRSPEDRDFNYPSDHLDRFEDENAFDEPFPFPDPPPRPILYSSSSACPPHSGGGGVISSALRCCQSTISSSSKIAALTVNGLSHLTTTTGSGISSELDMMNAFEESHSRKLQFGMGCRAISDAELLESGCPGPVACCSHNFGSFSVGCYQAKSEPRLG